jgi:starvation-inducible DNA-binding protein
MTSTAQMTNPQMTQSRGETGNVSQMIQMQCCVPNIGIDQNGLKISLEGLLQSYADQFTLKAKLHNYKYNVNGPRFTQLSKFFELQCCAVATLLESTAEMIRGNGARVPSVQEALKVAKISEIKCDWIDEDTMLKELLQDQERFIQFLTSIRQKISADPVVEDFVLDLIKCYRKMAWKTRSHLEFTHVARAISGQ